MYESIQTVCLYGVFGEFAISTMKSRENRRMKARVAVYNARQISFPHGFAVARSTAAFTSANFQSPR